METITNILYWISTGLLVPVIVALLFFFLRALLAIGTFYGTYIQKLRFNKDFKQILDKLDRTNVRDKLHGFGTRSKLPLVSFLRKALHENRGYVHFEKLLDDFEAECQKDLSGSQTLAKLGPVLGLMGTLIPMGPALVGLAAGDIASMAANMQVAFATTVIGLLTGAVGFVIMQVKRRWHAADISSLEFVANLLKQASENPRTKPKRPAEKKCEPENAYEL